MRVCGQEEEGRCRALMHHAVGDYLRIAVKQADEMGREYPYDQGDGFGNAGGAEDTDANALLCTIGTVRAQILADECGQRHVEARDRQEGKALNARMCAAARHGSRTECIDVGLDDDIGEGDNAIGDT